MMHHSFVNHLFINLISRERGSKKMKNFIVGLGSAAILVAGSAVAQAEPVHLRFVGEITNFDINPEAIVQLPDSIDTTVPQAASFDLVYDDSIFENDPTAVGEPLELVFRIGDEFEYYFASQDPDNVDGVTGSQSIDYFDVGSTTTLFLSSSVEDPDRNNDPFASIESRIVYPRESITEYTARELADESANILSDTISIRLFTERNPNGSLDASTLTFSLENIVFEPAAVPTPAAFSAAALLVPLLLRRKR